MKNFLHLFKNKKSKIIGWCIIGVCVISSSLFSFFGFGDFKEDKNDSIIGALSYSTIDYKNTYFPGESFVFNKNNSQISLIVKDPAYDEIINISDLPASDYGFKKNGTGEFCISANSIIVDENTEFISVVSKTYKNIFFDLPVVVGNQFLFEAEDANLYYTDGHLLTENEKATLPDTNKPFRSDKGSTKDGASCSGGACIRNFKDGMKLEYVFYSNSAQTANLIIKVCKRSSNVNFDDAYTIKINNQLFTTGAIIPSGSGYFEPYELPALSIELKSGKNTITFEKGSVSPNNLDAILLIANSAISTEEI